MSILNFDTEKCLKCSRCLRYCPSKAIKILSDSKACEIVEDLCIACGNCKKICTHDAIHIRDDFFNVKKAIKDGKKVIFSIAPAFPAILDAEQALKLPAALKKLGAYKVEETSIGAELVYKEYVGHFTEAKMKNLITTSCPAANYLIEIYYPELIQYMMPVISPMLAHGKLLKKTYRELDVFTVFVGPCLAKKFEAEEFQHDDLIDATIDFEALTEWLEAEKIFDQDLDKIDFDRSSGSLGSAFPLKGSISENIKSLNQNNGYQILHVDGFKECKEVLEGLRNKDIENIFLEINMCSNSCINGPGMPNDSMNYFARDRRVKEYVRYKKDSFEEKNKDYFETHSINLKKKFFDKSIKRLKANQHEIDEILHSMNKFNKDDQLNCAACGYNSCIEKAESVFEGMSDITTCLPFMQSKSEGIQNIIFEYTPNIIVVLDRTLIVKGVNPSFEKAFNVDRSFIENKHISLILDYAPFEQVFLTNKNILGEKIAYANYGLTVYQNIIYLEEHDYVIVIMTDITKSEQHKKELMLVREKTLDSAQKIIDKQMRVAQEIASLLGETTAETKITLNKLKKIAQGESGEGR